MSDSDKNTIKRSSHDKENPYVMTNRYSIQDKRLSWQATGLLAYLLSKTSDWVIRKDELCNNKTNGRDSTRKAFDELIKYKYILAIQLYSKNLKNGTAYYLYETPFDDEKEELNKYSLNDSRYAENPRADNRLAEKPTLLSKDLLNKDKKNKNIVQNTKSCSKPHDDFYFSLDDKKFIGITPQDIENWKLAYPSTDINQELMKAEEWCKSNPTKSKLKKKWRKFLTTWFNKNDERKYNQKAYQAMNGNNKTKTNSPAVHVSIDWDKEEKEREEQIKAYREKNGGVK